MKTGYEESTTEDLAAQARLIGVKSAHVPQDMNKMGLILAELAGRLAELEAAKSDIT